MKVLLVDQFSELGGAQRCFLHLLPCIEAHAALPGTGPLTKWLPSTRIPCGPYKTGAKSWLEIPRFASDLYHQRRILSALIEEPRFDLIYVNGPRVLPGAALASRGRIPMLFHAHNYLDAVSARIVRLGVRGANSTVIACSKFVAGGLGIPARVIPNASRDMGFRARSFEPPCRIGVIGRIEPQKGQLDFVKAALGFPNARYTICGEPESQDYYEQTAALARGIDVEFTGWRDDLDNVLSQLDFVVIPSSQEGFSLVMLEAFSAGAIVIAYARGGMPEVIISGETGFLVPECSPAGIVRVLTSLNARSLDQIARNARSLWEERYTIPAYQERMLSVMHEASTKALH